MITYLAKVSHISKDDKTATLDLELTWQDFVPWTEEASEHLVAQSLEGCKFIVPLSHVPFFEVPNCTFIVDLQSLNVFHSNKGRYKSLIETQELLESHS